MVWKTTLALFISFLSVFAVNAQTGNIGIQPIIESTSEFLSAQTSCTSNDLSVVGAQLTNIEKCYNCVPGTLLTPTLTITVENGTNSQRPKFAFWGTLERYDSLGNFISSEDISGCGGPIVGNKTRPTTSIDFQNINYTCGNTLKITNLIIAWTSAGDTSCPTIENRHPKCGTAESISVSPPLFPPIISGIAQPSCSNSKGTITLGKVTGVVYNLNGGIYQTSNIFENLSPGNYIIRSKNSDGCVSGPTAITINQQPITPDKPVAGEVTQPTCESATGSFQIVDFNADNDYDFTPSVVSISDSGLVTATAGTYSFTVTNEAGCISPASENVEVNEQLETPAAPVAGEVTQPTCESATGTFQIVDFNADNIYNFTPSVMSVSDSGLVTATAGTYSFTVTNQAGCISPASENVEVNEQLETPAAPIVSSTVKTTCNLNNGSISITEMEGTEFSIDGINYQTSGLFNDLAPATYFVTARFIDGECISDSTEIEIIAIPDTEDPELSEMSNIDVDTDSNACGAKVSFSAPTATDNCDGTVVTLNEGSLGSGSEFPVGTTTVTYTATDFAGNTSSVSFNVIVTDNEDPTITCPSAIVTITESGESYAIVNFENATATDNCNVTVEQTAGLTSGSQFPIGESVVEFTATDASGNTSTCNLTITVEDKEPPVIFCPTNIDMKVDAGICGAVVSFEIPSASDNSGLDVTVTQTAGPASGEVFPVGTTTVTFTATDAAGNSASCSFDVTVTDNEDPTFEPVSNIEVDTDADVCGAEVSFSAPTATDNCDGTVVTLNEGSLASGSEFPVGTTTVTYTATDAAGNTSTVSFDVIVTDNEDPTIACPSNIITTNVIGQNYAVVTYTEITATDNCNVTVERTSGLASGAQFPIGTTVVTHVATDASGNITECSFTVLVKGTPVAVDDAVTTNEDTSVIISVLGNDSDPDGDPLTIISNTNTSNGTVVLNENGTFTYTPNANYNGTDSFEYTISDGNGGTDTATVTITVVPVNDAPIALDDSASTNEDTPVTVSVLDNDSDLDGDALSVVSTTSPSNGTVVINENGAITYTPNENFNGTDSFEYTISDGNGGTDTATVTITVNAINDAPVAVDDVATTDEDNPITVSVLNNDSDIDGNGLTVTAVTTPSNGTAVINENGTITYTPNPDFNGTDSFEYTISDGNGGTDTATVTITVIPVDDAPPAPPTVTVTQPTCENPTGTITVETIDGLTYSLNGVDYQESGVFADLEPGTYSVIAQDGFEQDSEITEVTVNEPIAVVIETRTNVSQCYDNGFYNLFDLLIGDFDRTGTWENPNTVGSLDGSNLDLSSFENDLGTYTFNYVIAGNCPSTTEVQLTIDATCIVLDCSIDDIRDSISKAVTPNGDGFNDFFTIGVDLDCGFTFDVKIFNRWGAEIYTMKNYQNNWDGFSDKSFTSSNQLPSGTYYYIIEINGAGGLQPIQGYIYLGTK